MHETRIDFDINGWTVVLVDDVLFTGRTIRSALDALVRRPDGLARLRLLVGDDEATALRPLRSDLHETTFVARPALIGA